VDGEEWRGVEIYDADPVSYMLPDDFFIPAAAGESAAAGRGKKRAAEVSATETSKVKKTKMAAPGSTAAEATAAEPAVVKNTRKPTVRKAPTKLIPKGRDVRTG
jgi:hypothetical protein